MRFPIVCLWRRTSLLFLVVVGSILFAGMWFGLAGSTPVASATRAADAGLAWEPLGGPVGPGGQGNAVAVNPAVAGEVYVALIPNGADEIGPTTVYHSDDAADSWTPVLSTTIALHALAVRENVALAAGFTPVSGVIAYRSSDAGLTWRASYTLPVRGGWLGLSIHPTDTLAALAGGLEFDGDGRMQGRVYATADGGESWSPRLQLAVPGVDVRVTAALIHPLSPTIQFVAAATGGDAVIWRSANSGVAWTAVYTLTNTLVRSLAAHPEQPNLLYAGAGDSVFGGSPAAIYRSEDGGLTWAKVHEPGTFVAVAPSAVVAATTWGQTFRSTAHGDPGSWTEVAGSDSASALVVEYPPAVHVASATPLSLTSATYYLGAREWGVQKSLDAGDTWANQNNGLQMLVRPRNIAVNPANPAQMYAAAGCGGGHVSQNGGQSWAAVDYISGCMGGFAFDPADPSIVFGAGFDDSAGALARSDDGGLTFTRVYTAPHVKSDRSGGGEQLFAIVSAPLSPTLVLAGGEDNPAGESNYGVILRSVDRGVNWTRAAKVVGGAVEVLAIDPTDVRRAWAGGRACGQDDCGGFVLRSIDAGQTWTVTLVTSDTVASLAYDRFTGALYVGDRTYTVHKSEDGGEQWSVVRTANSAQGVVSGFLVVTDPYFPDRVILAGYGYVTESRDGGATWSDAIINLGTPSMGAGALTIDLGRETQTIYGGYSGVWRFARPGPSFVQLPELTKQ